MKSIKVHNDAKCRCPIRHLGELKTKNTVNNEDLPMQQVVITFSFF